VKSNEAGLKYIILGAFSSALLLYGISLLYGVLGTTYLPDIASRLPRLDVLPVGFGIALTLILAGLGFKIAAVPFHMWTPDVYEGAPTPITAYLSVASKAAGFALVMRVLIGGLLPIQDQYQTVFVVLAVLTMTLGNLVAIQQRNVKRLLAYSSISQAGYVLVGMAAITTNPDVADMAARGMMLHLAGYVFTNLAAFGAFIAFQNLNGGREMIGDLAGFARRAPYAGLAMMAALFSLAGMPLFAGFVTKFYLFAAAARADLLWLVAIAVINSTISLYYYLLVVYQMYVRTPPGFVEEAHGPVAVDTPAVAVAAALAPAYATAGGAGVQTAVRTSTNAMGRHDSAASAHGAALGVDGHGVDGRAPVSDGHAVHSGPNGHGGAHDGHGDSGGYGAHGGAAGPAVPWWRRSITGDMPPEQSFPQYRISWVTTLGLTLFVAGIFALGIYPAPAIDLLRDASSALFAG
jgi:NADH:ubiquinone oxidoreductase subunit 2 (subunit N)